MYSLNNTTSNNDKSVGHQSFLSQENAQMIWDLLQETDIYNNIDHQEKIEIRSQFTKNMRAFNDKHSMSTSSLMERNKLFIGVVLNQHRRTNIAESNQMKPAITLNKFPTSRDVQEERRKVFEQDLQRRKNEFENSMSMEKPAIPNFSDKVDEPISRMEDLINKTIESRELEMNQIFKSMASNPDKQEAVWLQETSVKSEKTSANNSNFKQIKIEKEENNMHAKEVTDIIDLNPKPVARNRVQFSIDEPTVANVSIENPLSKFKKLPSPISPALNIIPHDVSSDKGYSQFCNKIDEVNQKLDYIIGVLKENAFTERVPNGQFHHHDPSSNHKV